MSNGQYYGKFRGTVVDHVDPEHTGRIQVLVPTISDLPLSNWAIPCAPVAGFQMGIVAVPSTGSAVWIEFENGDPDYPIWVGGFWESAADVPEISLLSPPPAAAISIQTPLQNGIIVYDSSGPDGGIVLRSASGATITVSDTGIYIDNGKGARIELVGPQVTINGGALVVV